jgi:hypothetical protein
MAQESGLRWEIVGKSLQAVAGGGGAGAGVASYDTEYEYEPPVLAAYTLESYQHTPAVRVAVGVADDDESSEDGEGGADGEARGGSGDGEGGSGGGADERKWDADDAEHLRQTGPRVSMMSLKCVSPALLSCCARSICAQASRLARTPRRAHCHYTPPAVAECRHLLSAYF